MAELKECPFCGSTHVEFMPDDEQQCEDTTTGFIWCHACGFSSDSFWSEEKAVELWNRRPAPENKVTREETELEARAAYTSGYADGIKDGRKAPENKALTLEELRKMDGEPVWVEPLTPLVDEFKPHWCIMKASITVMSETHKGRVWFLHLCDYAKTWLAYRRKPKEEGDSDG